MIQDKAQFAVNGYSLNKDWTLAEHFINAAHRLAVCVGVWCSAIRDTLKPSLGAR